MYPATSSSTKSRVGAGWVKRCVCALVWAWSAAAYFVVTSPTSQTQWVNGNTHLITWDKGLLDGVVGYDVELTRMSRDELVLVAMNVPAKPPGLNIYIENIPAGDDYVLVFINSTHGVLQGTSERFSILDKGKTPSADSPTPTPVSDALTVSVTSGANPTAFFATTFPALPWNGAESVWMGRGAVGGVVGVTVVAVLSGLVLV